MRCFYVLVHGKLNWNAELRERSAAEVARPTGFYCHRHVLASGDKEAGDEALWRVRENLDRQTGWLREGVATLDLEAEEIAAAPMHKLLKAENRRHTFYEED